jgi:hypothetical protein
VCEFLSKSKSQKTRHIDRHFCLYKVSEAIAITKPLPDLLKMLHFVLWVTSFLRILLFPHGPVFVQASCAPKTEEQ